MTETIYAQKEQHHEVMETAQIECLQAAGLVKSFRGRKVVKGVAIEVRAGEVVVLLGPN